MKISRADTTEQKLYLERRLGEFFKRKTLKFNGYGSEVDKLYAGMDLKINW